MATTVMAAVESCPLIRGNTKRKRPRVAVRPRRLMSKVEAQERAKERELVRRCLEWHRRGRWLTRPFTFAMNIKQKKDDVGWWGQYQLLDPSQIFGEGVES